MIQYVFFSLSNHKQIKIKNYVPFAYRNRYLLEKYTLLNDSFKDSVKCSHILDVSKEDSVGNIC